MRPSYDDDIVTMRIREASKIIDITLIDHLIITKDGYYSYADAGRMI
jgi:DNA repair protein RadC